MKDNTLLDELTITIPAKDVPQTIDLVDWFEVSLDRESQTPDPLGRAWGKLQVKYEKILNEYELRLDANEKKNLLVKLGEQFQSTLRGLDHFLMGIIDLPELQGPSVKERAEAIRRIVYPNGRGFTNENTSKLFAEVKRRFRRIKRDLWDEIETLGGRRFLLTLETVYARMVEVRHAVLELREEEAQDSLLFLMRDCHGSIRDVIVQAVAWGRDQPQFAENAARILEPLRMMTELNERLRKAQEAKDKQAAAEKNGANDEEAVASQTEAES